MIYLKSLLSNLYVLAFFSGLITFFIGNKIYPTIIWTLRHRNLLDEPDHRSAHGEITPTMGGVGIYISFTFTLIILASFIGLENKDLITTQVLMGATMILLFLGIKDDLVPVRPKKKILGQFIAAAIVVLLADIRVFSFEGLLGIGVLPYSVSILFSIIVFVAMINAFNLIDGVDGLAGAIALVVSATFGVFFFLNGNEMYVLVSAVLIGAIIGFLRYNLSDRNKIFMGDTGSMVVGFLLCFQAFAFLELNALETARFSVSNGPIMVLAVLSYPILDTLRIFGLRIRDGRSPFSADRNHIHHRLLGLGMKHKQVTLLLVFVNVFIIEFAFITNDVFIDVQFFMVLGAVPFAFTLPFIKIREWLPKVFGVKNEAKPTKISDKSKVVNLKDAKKIPNTHLGGIPDSAAEFTVQQFENGVSEASSPEIAAAQDPQKISAKRVTIFKKAKKQNRDKKVSDELVCTIHQALMGIKNIYCTLRMGHRGVLPYLHCGKPMERSQEKSTTPLF